ncbi:MAG: hypothetical protein L7S63_03960 [Flavobacteriales bacterium]|nr:hypothetical protein [Flavobacteriales bacterium]
MNQNLSRSIRFRRAFACGFCWFACWLLPLSAWSQAAMEGNETPTWEAAIAAYAALAQAHPNEANLAAFGSSDVGRPLHLFTIGPDDASLRLLVNNAIHPGEPCGVNASLLWATSLLNGERSLPADIQIGIVPMYNIGGGLRRNCCTRANQNGPEEYGFRGNARNLDLNRDFIKCDSRNALSFNQMFSQFEPTIFVDTHTSNGADYQPTLTLITTQPDKLGGPMGTWLETTFAPALYAGMAAAGNPMVPYVNSMAETPDGGIADFLETPRYSTGYSALHHAIGFTTEAHMLKPFPERVSATLQFLDVLLTETDRQAGTLLQLKQAQHDAYVSQTQAAVAWELDTTAVDSLDFPGYEARYEWSNVTGKRRLRYDHDAPYQRPIPYMHTFRNTRTAPIPAAFVVPQAWRHVIERLEANGASFYRVAADTSITLEVARIVSHSDLGRPYEGHHYRTVEEVSRSMEPVSLFEGDLVFPCDQKACRYLVETLSPEGVDAFMAWNFFDSVLQQKEYFSSYVFEETAAALLAADAELKRRFEATLEGQGKDWSARQQLDWLYKRSDHYEQTPARYPIFSVPNGQPLPFQ